MKKFFVILLVVSMSVVLSGCGSTNGSESWPAVSKPASLISPKLIAETGGQQIYKFSDGDRTCYFTENISFKSAGGIWCTP
jgi:hypothetical protein